WTYLAATYDGSKETLYLNGAPVASVPLEDSIGVSDGNLKIGGNSVWSEWFSGLIDEVRVYNRALPQEEIQIDMTTPGHGHPGRLLAGGSIDGPVTNAWNTVAVAAQHVAAGTTYWIAVLGGSGQLAYRDRCCSVTGTGPTETEARTSLTDLPVRWTTGTVY